MSVLEHFTIFLDMVNNIFMNIALCGISCLEYDTIYKHLLLNSVVFEVISVVAIVGSIAILWNKPWIIALHYTILCVYNYNIVCTENRL